MIRVVIALTVLALTAAAQDRTRARSMVISERGIVATSQTLASQAAAAVLARGGSAVDAAIAANAVLGVVEPMMCGMGGDLFAIYWEAKSGKLYAINASGWAPKGMTLEFLKAKEFHSMPQEGIHSVTVPGCVDGWEKLHKRFGKLPWAEVFRPAVYFAEHGFPVTELISQQWRTYSTKLDREGRRVFVRDGRTPEVGEVFRNAPLAGALKAIAQGGAAAFYKGPIASAILKTSEKLGGSMAPEDLSTFSAEWVEPLATEYRGWKVYELPPNGQGVAVLEMLNILENFGLSGMEPRGSQELHLQIEAQKLAYGDLGRWVADPRFSKVPAAGLVSKKYARERAALIDRDRARCEMTPGNPLHASGDTIYLSAVDREGNIVSLIQSIYLAFGSGVVVEGCGFPLHNRGGLFVMDPAHPNAAAPRKRPFHTIIPGFMSKGDLRIGFGIMGGLNQAQAHAQFVSNVVDHGMNIQAALEAPRFTKLTWGGCDVMIERRVSESTRDALRQMGHQIDLLGDFSSQVGGGQAVAHDLRTGVNYGASSPRKDGAAVPEAHPYFK